MPYSITDIKSMNLSVCTILNLLLLFILHFCVHTYHCLGNTELLVAELLLCIIIIYVYRFLLICDKRPYIGLLKSIMVGLGSHAPNGVDHICNKGRLICWLVSMHFSVVYLINLMYAST